MVGLTNTVDSDLHDKSGASWLSWLPTSQEKLILAEDKIFQRLTCSLEKFFLPVFDSSLYLRTIIARNYKAKRCSSPFDKVDPETKIPMVLIHGFAAGCGLWCKNIDNLSKSRRVFAFDMLGFGRSSRPEFPATAEEVEGRFVEVIEEWRKQINLDKFIIVGHSMGGFLAASYCLQYPEHVAHIILVDPWGFIGQEEGTSTVKITGLKGWLFKKLSSFRALSTMRLAGPFGPNIMRKVRQDFELIFYQLPMKGDEIEIISSDDHIESETDLPSATVPEYPWASTNRLADEEKPEDNRSSGNNGDVETMSPFDPAVVYNYIYHINVRNPSGEDAFLRMSQRMGWAARPMLHRLPSLKSSLPITFIYGGRSWVDMSSGLRARALRQGSYVDVMVIEGGGHHAYAQYADEFNDYVNAVVDLVDVNHNFQPGSEELVQKMAASRSRSSMACGRLRNRGRNRTTTATISDENRSSSSN